MSRLYPLGLRLAGKTCLVVGAGVVAERKLRALLAAGALVHVVAPDATPAIQAMAEAGRITWTARPAVPADLGGCLLAFLCSDDRATNHRLAEEAQRQGVLVNVADAPEEGNVVSPALVERDEVLIAVWSGGGGPVVSQLVRDRIAGGLGDEWAGLSRVVARCRAEINRPLPAARRTAFWRGAIDEELLTLLRQGDEAGAEALLREKGAQHGLAEPGDACQTTGHAHGVQREAD
jgi:precorrin-2 dehydrogenase / sirohydrochlorin ferrochelatase